MAVKASTSPQEIQTFANDCKQKHDDLMTAIRALKAKEDQTTATWSGNARQAFDSFMERYYFQADKLNDKLLQTTDSLLKSAKQFEDQDADFSAKVQQQVSSLDLPAL